MYDDRAEVDGISNPLPLATDESGLGGFIQDVSCDPLKLLCRVVRHTGPPVFIGVPFKSDTGLMNLLQTWRGFPVAGIRRLYSYIGYLMIDCKALL